MISANTNQTTMTIGNGATIALYGTRIACTIIKASKSRLTIQADRADRVDTNDAWSGAQQYRYSADTDGTTWTAARGRDGAWRVSRSNATCAGMNVEAGRDGQLDHLA